MRERERERERERKDSKKKRMTIYACHVQAFVLYKDARIKGFPVFLSFIKHRFLH